MVMSKRQNKRLGGIFAKPGSLLEPHVSLGRLFSVKLTFRVDVNERLETFF